VGTELLHSAQRGFVCTLTLDSPHNRNALSEQLVNELADALHDAVADEGVRLIMLTGSGTVFCSGADLSERGRRVTSRLPEILTTMVSSATPVVTRVNGHARAGGMGLIAASDLSVAATGSTFAFSEVRVGVAPAMILVPALRVADRRFLVRMSLTGETFGAAEAAAAGLLSAVVEDQDGLDAWVHGIEQAIGLCAPGAVAATKRLLADLPELGWLFGGAEAAEGMEAFLNKRSPSWVAAP
jgi:methylglutaconyl-CoA hydratase